MWVNGGRLGDPMRFKDHFSGHADRYAAHRPSYPPELFKWLAQLVPSRRDAWDCGAGNGQAAHGLAEHFARVLATDASATQIGQASRHDRILFAVAPAERAPLADGSVDLIVVAQALHWFDHGPFFNEVQRVGRPHAIVACWCYALQTIDPAIDAVVRHYYDEVVGPYWPPERRLVEGGYRSLPFPFEELPSPTFAMRRRWDLDDVLGYLVGLGAISERPRP